MKKIFLTLLVLVIASEITLANMLPDESGSIDSLIAIGEQSKRNAAFARDVTDCESVTEVTDDTEVQTLYSGIYELECSVNYIGTTEISYIFHIKK